MNMKHKQIMIYQQNHQTYNYLVKGNHITEREIKGLSQFLFIFLQKPLYEVCLVRIKEQVGHERSCICELRVSNLHLSSICLLGFGNVPRSQQFQFFMLLLNFIQYNFLAYYVSECCLTLDEKCYTVSLRGHVTF